MGAGHAEVAVIMIINQFECPADMDALNTELRARKVGPDLLAAVILTEEASSTGWVTKFRVLYWDPTGEMPP